jgi:hypothetical protein
VLMKEDTYPAELSKDLPHSCFIKAWTHTTELPQEAGKVPKLTELRLDEQLLILFPAVDIAENVRVRSSQETSRLGRPAKVLKHIDLFS